MSRTKKSSPRGPTTVVLERDLIDALDTYRRAHPLKPGRRYIVAEAVRQYIQNSEARILAAGDKS